MNLRKGESNSASNLLPPSSGGPVWPQAIQRSGVRNDFSFETAFRMRFTMTACWRHRIRLRLTAGF
jgi:hypothetical protein